MFYCKIATVQGNKISVLPVLITLIMLSEGKADEKSRLIVDQICKHAATLEALQIDEVDFEYQVLSKHTLNLILVTVVSVALVVLPIFAADFPSTDRLNIIRILVEWPKKADKLCEKLRLDIQQDSITGRVHANQFIAKATALGIYDTWVLRQLSRKIEVEDTEARKVPISLTEGVVMQVVNEAGARL